MCWGIAPRRSGSIDLGRLNVKGRERLPFGHPRFARHRHAYPGHAPPRSSAGDGRARRRGLILSCAPPGGLGVTAILERLKGMSNPGCQEPCAPLPWSALWGGPCQCTRISRSAPRRIQRRPLRASRTRIFLALAELGDCSSQFNLAAMALKGQGGPKDAGSGVGPGWKAARPPTAASNWWATKVAGPCRRS